MKALIVEDEYMVARRLRRMVLKAFSLQDTDIRIVTSLYQAFSEIKAFRPDIVFLDLNLDSEDGFDLLQSSLLGPHQTIVASANTDRAIEAYEHGILDFVPKPFSAERLDLAAKRFQGTRQRAKPETRLIPVRAGSVTRVLDVSDISHISAADGASEIHLAKGVSFHHNKSLAALGRILPRQFMRIHRSHIANLDYVSALISHRGSRYSARFRDGLRLPLGRKYVKPLREALSGSEAEDG